jgi:hypothetical protein
MVPKGSALCKARDVGKLSFDALHRGMPNAMHTDTHHASLNPSLFPREFQLLSPITVVIEATVYEARAR